MTRNDAVKIASAAAQGAFVMIEQKPARKWWQALAGAQAGPHTLEDLAAFAAAHPSAGAEALYRTAKGAAIDAEPWGSAPAQEAAARVFWAAMAQLLVMAREAEIKAERAKPAAKTAKPDDRWMGAGTFEETAPGMTEQGLKFA